MSKKYKNRSPSSYSSENDPTSVWELLNKYGTYNIQPTADTDNTFPQISQESEKK